MMKVVKRMKKYYLKQNSILTRQGYLSCINEASDGQHLLDIINLLPNSARHYGHSLTMNAIIKTISRHLVFCEQSNPLFVTKHKSRKDVQVTATFSSLSKETQVFLKCLVH